MPTAVSYEIVHARNLSVSARLRNILPLLAGTYAVVTLFSKDLLVILAATAVSLVSVIIWALLRRNVIPPAYAHFAGWGIGLLVLGDGILRIYASSDPSRSLIVMMLLIGSAYALNWEDFALVALVSATGWGAALGFGLVRDDTHGWSVGLLATAMFSGLGAWLRYRQQYQANLAVEPPQEVAPPQTGSLDDATSHEHLALAVQGTQDGLWYWDLKNNIFQFSSSWEALLGFEKGELSTDPEEWFRRVHPGYLAELRTKISQHLDGNSDQFRFEHRMRQKDGNYFWVSARATVTRDSAGEAIGLAGSHSDITPLITVERQLLDDAFHDKLTSLPNRHFFMGRLDTIIEQRRQSSRSPMFAVMFLDLDRFKSINDTLGHQVGDQLLICVASRLRNCVSHSDVVARLGGDEFVVLLDSVRDPEEALSVGKRISEALSTPFEIGGKEVLSGASIGVALSREPFNGAEDLVRLADLAMYHSKAQRKGRPELFHERMNLEATKSSLLQKELARALKQEEFLLDYQPCFSIQTGKILGVEALIRWKRSPNEILSPTEFIPLAEESGLIHEIGEWVLKTACEQSRAWQKAGAQPIRMAVNLSAKQLQRPDFPQRLMSILGDANMSSRWLDLELTETALMDSFEKAPDTLNRLDKMGIRTSIDDFGTGYSSLNYLRRFNFQTLKMDRCFVSDISTDKKAAAIVKSLISLAHNLDISVIAEGVETDAQLSMLAAERCDQVQGFLTSRPMAPDQMLSLLHSVGLNKPQCIVATPPEPEFFRGYSDDPILQLGAVLAER